MSEADRQKWDDRYRAGAYAERDYPTQLLAEWEPKLARGRALDIACGAGRNSLFLAAGGWQVDAIDISPVGLARAEATAASRGLCIHWIEADLEVDSGPVLPRGRYDLIVMTRYVNRPLFPLLPASLECSGTFICEQHLDSAEDVSGPKSPDFRMRHNELLHAVIGSKRRDYSVLYYREGLVTDPDGRDAALAQLVMRRECG
jgi:SAM-dependent methyltransferase